jgi:hypothetical protein
VREYQSARLRTKDNFVGDQYLVVVVVVTHGEVLLRWNMRAPVRGEGLEVEFEW